MPNGLKIHSAVFVQAAARNLLRQGIAAEAVFDGTAFDAALLREDSPAAPLEDVAAFFEHAAEISGETLFGFRLGLEEDLRHAGLAAYAGLASADVGGFLTRFARYIPLYSDAVEANVSRLGSEGLYQWDFRVSPVCAIRQYTEFGAASLLATLRFAAQHKIQPSEVRFRHSRRPGIAEMESAFGCGIVFGAAANAVVLKPADLGLPLVTADEKLLKVLVHCGDRMLSSRQTYGAGLAASVERAIADRLAEGTATLDTVATDLGMSPRTLSRKLSQEGTSYFSILEELRKSLALRYLGDKDLVLAEIAFLLGYASLSSFNDAFKRWTGRSPGQYRAK